VLEKEGSPLWQLAADIYEHATGRELNRSEAKAFVDSCWPAKAMLFASCVGQYHWGLKDAREEARFKAGRWTDYLSKISSEWSKRVGKGTSVNFPVGLGARFNEGVQEEVKSHPYSMGYLEVAYAVQGHVQYGLVQNSSGTFVKATGASITAAALAKDMPDDFRASITNAPASDAYPISSFTWLLVPERIADSVKSKAIVEFVRWVLTDGQKLAPALNYAPLPTVVASRALKAIDRVQ
jgi:phosphate transport system substrate-binding protein